MRCHMCGHKIGAWNADPYRIGDDVYCDRCWAAHGEEMQAAARQANRERLAAQQREYREKNREKVALERGCGDRRSVATRAAM